MSRIEFEIDNLHTRKSKGENTGLGALVQKYSFGLIKTQKSAEVFLIILFFVLISGAVMTLNRGDVVEIRQPDKELINAVQPVKPL